MKVSLYYSSQTFGMFCVLLLIGPFCILIPFLYISLISEPFPAFPPVMTGEFSCHVPTLMIVVFLCRCFCFLLVAQHSLQQLICSVQDHLLVGFLCLYCDGDHAQRLSHIFMSVAGWIRSVVCATNVSVSYLASSLLSSLPCHSQHGQCPGMHMKFHVKSVSDVLWLVLWWWNVTITAYVWMQHQHFLTAHIAPVHGPDHEQAGSYRQ